MKLNGIHHITAITGDAQANVDFYTRVLGLRMVKKSVNQDDPTVYHLFYGDEHAKPGLDLLLRVSGRPARPRRRRHDPPDRVARRLAGGARLLGDAARGKGSSPSATASACASAIPRASSTSWASSTSRTTPLIAEHPEVPAEHAFRASTACARTARIPSAAATCSSRAWASAPPTKAGRPAARAAAANAYDQPPGERGLQGAGTVHHVAWGSTDEEHSAWRARIRTRRPPDRGDRPALLPLDLLPRAERRAVRAGHAEPRLHDRRAARDAGREALDPALPRVAPGADRGGGQPLEYKRAVSTKPNRQDAAPWTLSSRAASSNTRPQSVAGAGRAGFAGPCGGARGA